MFAKVFAGTMKASLHRGDTGLESLGNFRVAAPFLDESQQGAVLRSELRQRMAQRVEFLGIDSSGRLGNIFMLLAEREKNPPQLLAAELVDAGIAGEAEKPRLKLRRRLEAVEGPDHFDEDLLGQILHIIASSGHGVNKAGNTMLVTDNELPLGVFVAFLSPADKVSQCGRCS